MKPKHTGRQLLALEFRTSSVGQEERMGRRQGFWEHRPEITSWEEPWMGEKVPVPCCDSETAADGCRWVARPQSLVVV